MIFPVGRLALVQLCAVTLSSSVAAQHVSMVTIPGGDYRPLYSASVSPAVHVASFRIDRHPVTRWQYLEFVRASPAWQKVKVPSTFADRETYLMEWEGPLNAGAKAELNFPVTSVSWHAARAYCAAQPGGKRLPTLAEWEYVARASSSQRDASGDHAFAQHLVTLYTTRKPRSVHHTEANAFGVHGMHDAVWEWVADPNETIAALYHASHEHVHAGKRDMSCSAAAIGAADPRDYAGFLRYAVRSMLTPTAASANMGFRCAR